MSDVITLDLRELAGEWEELLGEREELRADDESPTRDAELEEMDERVKAFHDLCGELGVTPVEPDTLRWYGEQRAGTLIREDTFPDYCREFAEDVHGDLGELYSFIDWDRYADAMRQDYYELSWDGHEWLRRA